MIFYEIVIHTAPQLVFACHVDLDNYHNSFPNIPNLLEFAICEEGDILYEYDDGTTEVVKVGSFTPITRDLCCTTRQLHPGRQRHTTIGVTCEYSLKRHDTDTVDIPSLRERMEKTDTVLVPFHCSLEDRKEVVYQLIKRTIRHNNDAKSKLEVYSDWYHICDVLTRFVIEKLDDSNSRNTPSARRYTEKTIEYIHDHYREQIKVPEISKFLGISSGYLQKVFGEVMNLSIIEYVNRYRVRLATEYIKSRNLSLKEAAALVGIDDAAYMSRIFKKITGISYREFIEK